MNKKLKSWLLDGYVISEGYFESEKDVKTEHQHTHPWWQVMCLTGVDYFSTLGYQPSIAFIAAGALSPVATLVLILLTLFGALPIYAQIAKESPHGEGSISMLKGLLSRWNARLFVLALLGFVATDFVITITLSAADAATHVRENPLFHTLMEHNPVAWQIGITLGLILLLGAVFLKGFKEAIGIAVVLVIAYLGMNAAVIGKGISILATHPDLWTNWGNALELKTNGNHLALVGLSLLYFPKLALGLSGFETGVAVMPLVTGDKDDTEEVPAGRVRSTKKLLVGAALVMSVYLIASSLVTTMLIPAEAFKPHEPANGRALAYLAYEFYGKGFGTFYDISTIAILWFAGASAMAGLLNIVPRYLPGYGMAPEWTRATRPLVMVFMAIAIVVTIVFKANVDAQGGAYATGVLVLMTSAAVAVTISMFSRHGIGKAIPYGVISLVFLYTTVVNVVERPDGVKIASFFIFAILAIAFVSRMWRVTELRVKDVILDEKAQWMIEQMAKTGEMRFIANHPDAGDAHEYSASEREASWLHHFSQEAQTAFVEVYVGDSSEFRSTLMVEGHEVGGFWVLRCKGVAVPNGIAALMIKVATITNRRPHVYFHWIESSPLLFLAKFFLSGQGDIAPLTHEILRRAVQKSNERPVIHVAG